MFEFVEAAFDHGIHPARATAWLRALVSGSMVASSWRREAGHAGVRARRSASRA